jgi:putative protease
MKPNGDNIEVEVKNLFDEDGNEVESCPHSKQMLYVDLGVELDEYDILRRREKV